MDACQVLRHRSIRWWQHTGQRCLLIAPGLSAALFIPRLPGPAIDILECSDFLRQFNMMLAVQSCLQKYSRSRLTQIRTISPPSRPTEGRLAIVTDAGRDAVAAAALGTYVIAGRVERSVSDRTAC
jgi:hypothetical protein